jgi:hypothetical protein
MLPMPTLTVIGIGPIDVAIGEASMARRKAK